MALQSGDSRSAPIGRKQRRWSPRSVLLLALVLVFAGTSLLVPARSDYSDHTGRAEAVVTRVEARANANSVIRIDYRAEGRRYTDVELGGMTTRGVGSSHDEVGETVTIAYDPAEPGDPVTEKTVREYWPWVFGAASAVAYAGAAAAATAGTVSLVRGARRRRS